MKTFFFLRWFVELIRLKKRVQFLKMISVMVSWGGYEIG